MSHFRPIELKHASRLLNHGPTILITSRDEHTERRNVMAAAWSMPVEFEPPRIAIVVDKTAWSRELIERSGKFGIVIPGVAAVNWTWAVGSVSGRVEDKFNCYGIPVVHGPVLGLPLIEAKCLAWSVACCQPRRHRKNMTLCLGKWSPLPLMSEPSWKDAGSLMMASSILCITLGPERLSPAGNALSQVNDSMLTDGSSALSSATVFLKPLKNQLDKLLCLPCLIINVNYS